MELVTKLYWKGNGEVFSVARFPNGGGYRDSKHLQETLMDRFKNKKLYHVQKDCFGGGIIMFTHKSPYAVETRLE